LVGVKALVLSPYLNIQTSQGLFALSSGKKLS